MQIKCNMFMYFCHAFSFCRKTIVNYLRVPNKVRNQAKVEVSHGKENCHFSPKQINVFKVNLKGTVITSYLSKHMTCFAYFYL